jgi:hypothetical protein
MKNLISIDPLDIDCINKQQTKKTKLYKNKEIGGI